MEWTISFLSDLRIVVIKTQGVADEVTSLEMAKTISKTMNEHQSMRCLIDHRDIRSFSGNVVKIYHRPKELNAMDIPPSVRIAELVLQEHNQYFGFFETVCRNRNLDFQIFNDQESAIEWLTK